MNRCGGDRSVRCVLAAHLSFFRAWRWHRPLGRFGGTAGFEKGPSRFCGDPRACLAFFWRVAGSQTLAQILRRSFQTFGVPTFAEPEPGDGPVLVTVEYKIDPVEALEFLEAIHSTNAFVAATARPAGASSMTPNPQGSMSRPTSRFLVEHQRQHGQFTIADRTVEIEQTRKAVRLLPTTGH